MPRTVDHWAMLTAAQRDVLLPIFALTSINKVLISIKLIFPETSVLRLFEIS